MFYEAHALRKRQKMKLKTHASFVPYMLKYTSHKLARFICTLEGITLFLKNNSKRALQYASFELI